MTALKDFRFKDRQSSRRKFGSFTPVENQELRVLQEAEIFRGLAEKSWDEHTIHPASKYIPGKSVGNCGVTNFGFGIWLAQKGIVNARQLFYEEGRLVRPNNDLICDNHASLLAVIDDGYQNRGLKLRVDHTADQFPGMSTPVTVQYEDYFYPDEQTEQGNRVYAVDTITPLVNYDVRRFRGRLGRFMLNVYEAADPGILPTNYLSGLALFGIRPAEVTV